MFRLKLIRPSRLRRPILYIGITVGLAFFIIDIINFMKRDICVQHQYWNNSILGGDILITMILVYVTALIGLLTNTYWTLYLFQVANGGLAVIQFVMVMLMLFFEISSEDMKQLFQYLDIEDPDYLDQIHKDLKCCGYYGRFDVEVYNHLGEMKNSCCPASVRYCTPNKAYLSDCTKRTNEVRIIYSIYYFINMVVYSILACVAHMERKFLKKTVVY